MYKVNKGVVKYEGAYHAKGSFFDANESDVITLLEKGIISRNHLEESTRSMFSEAPDQNPIDQDDDDYLPSMEDFEKMSAGEQKQLLSSLDIEPAAKAEDRLNQYSDFYNQVEADEL